MTDPPKTVAVGYDGSADSAVALRWAAALCHSLDASLKIIHVVGLLEEQHLSGRASVHSFDAVAIAQEAGVAEDRVEWHQLSGSPAEALLRATEPPHSVDLLVVGSRGSGRRPAMVLGSTSLEVAERSPVPVAVVPNAV